MIRISIVLALARAEARLTRRLVRYWLFQALAAIIGFGGFMYYWWIHWAFSSWSGTAALLNPRFLVGFIGIYYLVLFLLGLVFLGFDIRARDTRERIVEVLDSRPYTNLELILGKFVGIMLACWVPVLIVCAGLAILGAALGSAIEPRSLVTFAIFMAIPAYTFVLGLAFLLTILLRHRLLAAVVLIAVIVGLVVINFGFVPIYLLPAVDITGGFSVPPPSDIVPGVIDGFGFLQRVGFLLAGLGMLWIAAAVHPRRDDASRGTQAALGAALIGVGALCCLYQITSMKGIIARKAQWKAAHEARSGDPAPDLLAMSGDIVLHPGKDLQMKLGLQFRAPEDTPLDSALFSLNPGMQVRSITGADGGALDYRFEDGLLDVTLADSLAPGAEGSIDVELAGRPDRWFAYLDAVFDPLTLNIQEGNIFLLGFYSVIFDRRHVALLPGIRWLPASGAEIGRDDPRKRPRDFFGVDLTVELPEGWLAAGPGRRRDAEGAPAGRVRYRFAPGAPVPEVALVAGPFVGRSLDVEGVRLEVLVDRKHTANLDFLEDASEEIESWISEHLKEAADVGLAYPYDGMTLVEVAAGLRGFGGGWRMDTTLSQPGMVLMRESGFPTARFSTPFRHPERYRDREGGIPRGKREVLERFFENDFSGGNPFVAAARSFFSDQTAGKGAVGLPLDYVYEDLSTRLVTDKQGYFSVHHYGKDLNQTINATIGAIFQGNSRSVSDALIDSITSRSDVWDEVLEVSLEDLDPWEAPRRALDVLTLKAGAMSRSMLDGLGREKTGEVMSALRERSGGGSFDREEVVEVGRRVGVDLDEWLDVWISGTDLPGFSLGEVTTRRIKDTDDGAPRYQTRLVLRNDEPTPGLVRLDYRAGRPIEGGGQGKGKRKGPGGRFQFDLEQTEPFRVQGPGAVEFGIVTSEPMRVLKVVPYLALNRAPFNVALPQLDEKTIVDAEPFVGAREVEWTAPDEPWIIVDDLDEGFSVVDDETGAGLRIGGRGVANQDTDQGLPIAIVGQGVPGRWSRRVEPQAYGKYRHTIALVKAGNGGRRAIFSAEIPRAGEWELEYYLPESRRRSSGSGRGRGSWTLSIVDSAGDDRQATLDAENADAGWNSLGTFEIPDGATRVELSDAVESGRYVIADAIRWTPVSGGAPEAGTP